jgi:hypothetical protein
MGRWSAIEAATAITLVLWMGACGGGADETDPSADASPEDSATAASAEEVCFEEGEDFEGEALLYIEHNATDGDTGVHGVFDQDGLAEACIQKPDGSELMLVDPTNELGDLGINQFFFESREPPNKEYSIADLEADFPEGNYLISGVDLEGTERLGSALFTHDIPTPPEITSPKVVDERKAEQNELPASGITVRWREVTETLDGKPIDITGYEVIVTDDEHEDPNSLSQPEYDVHVPPDMTELEVPDGFLEPGRIYEVEVLALEKSGNQTISLGYFTAS